jgi:hypothetical protein
VRWPVHWPTSNTHPAQPRQRLAERCGTTADNLRSTLGQNFDHSAELPLRISCRNDGDMISGVLDRRRAGSRRTHSVTSRPYVAQTPSRTRRCSAVERWLERIARGAEAGAMLMLRIAQ